jgi:K+ transporter
MMVSRATVFLTRAPVGVPPVMIWHLRQNRALHERVLVLTVLTKSKPQVDAAERLSVVKEGDHFWRIARSWNVPISRAYWQRRNKKEVRCNLTTSPITLANFRLPAERVVKIGRQIPFNLAVPSNGFTRGARFRSPDNVVWVRK